MVVPQHLYTIDTLGSSPLAKSVVESFVTSDQFIQWVDLLLKAEQSGIMSQENCHCWCCSNCGNMQAQKSGQRRRKKKEASSTEHLSIPAKCQRSNGELSVIGDTEVPHHFVHLDCECEQQDLNGSVDKCTNIEVNQNNIVLNSPSETKRKSKSVTFKKSLITYLLNQPKNGVCAVDTEDDEVQSQFVDAFVHNNRLEHIVQVMGYHPQYLDCFLKTQQYILRGDGPLPYAYRHYIAIMAAGRHQCSYLINIQSAEFLLQGGNPKWLNGLDHIPKKLRDLYEFNKVMAHRPWLISKSHIENLTRGNDNWSMSELMHAVIILAHFHALSSFVYGCGISAEIDHSEGHTFRPPSLSASPVNGSPPLNNHSNTSSSMEECGIETLMERMKRLNEETEEPSEEELLQRFKKVETQSAELPAATQQPSPKADILRYVTEADFTYQDFAKRSQVSELPTFKAQDYSWDDHGFSLANRLYTDIGNLLDDKFKIAYNLTYYTMGDNHDVDTSSFRRAIWYYIHCMYGIRHDDYDYSEVNHLLERNLKAYVKTTTCYPERVTKKHYESFMREFKHSEKVHVNLMVFEARLQAELLYALRAITRHMT